MIALPKTAHQGVGGARFELKSVELHNLCGLHNNEGSLTLGAWGGEGMGCGAGQERTFLKELSATAPQIQSREGNAKWG